MLFLLLCVTLVYATIDPALMEARELMLKHHAEFAEKAHEAHKRIAAKVGLHHHPGNHSHNMFLNKDRVMELDGKKEGDWEDITDLLFHGQLSARLLEIVEEWEDMGDLSEKAAEEGKVVKQEKVVKEEKVPVVHNGRKLFSTRSGPPAGKHRTDPATAARLKSQGRLPKGCSRANSLSAACFTTYRPDLAIIGVTGNVGYAVVAGFQSGLEFVMDLDTMEVSFWRYHGHIMGTTMAAAQAEGSIYAGMGHKGTMRGRSIRSAYSGYFLCGVFGGNFIGGWGVTTCTSASGYTTPHFEQVKTITTGPSLSAVPTAVTVNFALPSFAVIASYRCQNPYCAAALVMFAPADIITKVHAMNAFMNKYCRNRARESICIQFAASKETAKKMLTGVSAGARQLLAWAKSGKLSGHIGRAYKAAADYVKQLVVSPEKLPNSYHNLPKGRGTYLKLHSCSPFAGAPHPYFVCSGNGVTKTTEIGVPLSSTRTGKVYWDYNRNQAKSGYGLWFPSSNPQCVTCRLVDKVRFNFDKGQNASFRVCTGSMSVWGKVYVRRKQRWIGTCAVKFLKKYR